MKEKESSNLQSRAFSYWKKAQTTYLASKEYYDKQEFQLREVLQAYGPFENCLDIGCGDGRYSLVALQYAKQVTGIDIGTALLAQAVQNKAEHSDGDRVIFLNQSMVQLKYASVFDLVMCLGVISTLIEDELFQQTVAGIGLACQSGSWLITKDTLAMNKSYISQQGDYVACYRNQKIYVDQFTAEGFELVHTKELIKGNELTVNSLFVFRKT